MIKMVSKIFLIIYIAVIIIPINVKAETIDNIELGGTSKTADGTIVTGNNLTATYTKTIEETKTISRSIRVDRDLSEDDGSCGSINNQSVNYTAYVTQKGTITYIMPGNTVTAGMSFPLEVYYETEISYTIKITSVPRYYRAYTYCCKRNKKGSCTKHCCRQVSTSAVKYHNFTIIPNYTSSSQTFFGLNTEYVDGSYTPALSSIGFGNTSSETARQLAEVDMQRYLEQMNNNIKNRMKVGIKVSYPDSNQTDSNYQLQDNQVRYTSWKTCTDMSYTETDGSEPYYMSKGTSESYLDKTTWTYRWKRDLGWKEGRKAYAHCKFYLNNAYINRTDGTVVYANSENYGNNDNYISGGIEIFTPIDMKSGIFPVNIQITNLGLLSIFNSSKWSTNDTININVVQKYYNETYDSAGNVTGYDGFSFYYRPIALSTQSAGVYSLDPFPTNNYIPANFIKWLYINGEIGDGSSSSNGLLNKNNQYQSHWQRLTQEYLNGKMDYTTAEYYVELTRNFMSEIQKYNSSVSYLNNSLRSNGYSEFIEKYRNYIKRNDEPAKLGEVKEEDWQVLLRK